MRRYIPDSPQVRIIAVGVVGHNHEALDIKAIPVPEGIACEKWGRGKGIKCMVTEYAGAVMNFLHTVAFVILYPGTARTKDAGLEQN